MFKRQQGVTLIELISCLAIAAIISATAIPYVAQWVTRQQLSSDLISILGLIETARNHAITHNTRVRLCGYSGSIVEHDQYALPCSASWAKLQVAAVTKAGDGELLRSYQLQAGYSKIIWSAFQRKNYLEFQASGFTAHQNGTLYLCHQRYPTLNRAIVISKSGRVTIKQHGDALASRCSGQ